MGDVELSIVAPVFNEAAILRELVRRCVAAGEETGMRFEVLFVDDASTDGTEALCASLRAPIRVLRLAQNRGQLGATLHGLREAQGELCVVLDGDLQDPPELIPQLVEALDDTRDVVFAVKTSRHDPLWFRFGRAIYGLLSRVPGARAVPAGAGSYCVLRRTLAAEVASMATRWGTLANLVVLSCSGYGLVSYEKQERIHGTSRVGLAGLIREALWSLTISRAVTAWSFWSGCSLLASSLLFPAAAWRLRSVALGAFVAALLSSHASRRLRRGARAPETSS